MSKKLAAIAVLALGMFVAAPGVANAHVPSAVTIHTEDEAPDLTATPEAVAYSSDEDGAADDTAGSTDDVDPQITESGVGIEEKMLTTSTPEAEQNSGNTALIAGVAAAVVAFGAGSFFILRARKRD